MLGDDVHTFAIGDVHGRADLLEELLYGIWCKAGTKRFKYRVVFLGDIIDRGPDSRRAMDLVVRTIREVPGSQLILGNHESLLLRIFDEGDSRIYNWWDEGGQQTLASYGYTGQQPRDAAAIRDIIDPEHIECMLAAKHYIELENHILVHAGIKPGVPIEQQDPYDLLWIRAGFLDHVPSFGKMIVHGHTPNRSNMVEQWPNRIAVDTGAYESDLLAAAHIDPAGDVSVVYAFDLVAIALITTRETVPKLMDWETVLAEKGWGMDVVDGLAVPVPL